MMESEWRDAFVKKSINEIREIVYDTRAKATEKKSELRSVVRQSHRDLLKTANTVVDMRDILDDVESKYKRLMTFTPDLIAVQASNAERYQKFVTGGSSVRIASAIGFVKASIDITQTHDSLLLGAKAILASRLALNTLPKDSNPYFQSLRDRVSAARTTLLKRIDRALLLVNPLEALISYALITGSSPPEVLSYCLSIRLNSTKSALMIQPSNSRAILQIVQSIISTITDIHSLFPFTVQRRINELKSRSLLDHHDLRSSLTHRRANIELWIESDIRKFLIWTKSEILNESKVGEMLQTWMNDVEAILKENAESLFEEIQELDLLCALRGEALALLIETEDEPRIFRKKICDVLMNEIAGQITRIITGHVKKLQSLGDAAKEIISDFGGGVFGNWLMIVDGIAVSIWEPAISRQLKLGQILTLKTAQERLPLKPFAVQYSTIMKIIHAHKVKLSQLLDSSMDGNPTNHDISAVLATTEEVLLREFQSCSQAFETILNHVMQDGGLEEDLKAAQIVCWLRLVSIVRNPPQVVEKFELVNSFAASARSQAQNYLSGHIASKVISLAEQLLSSCSWSGSFAEQKLWEGDPRCPVQPSRTPIRLLKEIVSRLNSMGIELLDSDFMLATVTACREGLARVYGEILVGEKEISSDAAMQLLADVMFLSLALSGEGKDDMERVRKKLLEKCNEEDIMERLTTPVKVYWKRTGVLFGILVLDESGTESNT